MQNPVLELLDRWLAYVCSPVLFGGLTKASKRVMHEAPGTCAKQDFAGQISQCCQVSHA